MASSKVKLYYFNLRARAEVIRLVLAAGGKEYEDFRFKDHADWFQNYKAMAPFNQAPFVEINGKKYAQSFAIAQFFAREFNLYGNTNLDALEIEQVECLVQDLMGLRRDVRVCKDPEKKAELAKTLDEEHFPRFIGHFEKVLKENNTGFFVGKSLTLADLAVFDILDLYVERHPGSLDSCPNLVKNRQNVASAKGVAEYLKARPPSDF